MPLKLDQMSLWIICRQIYFSHELSWLFFNPLFPAPSRPSIALPRGVNRAGYVEHGGNITTEFPLDVGGIFHIILQS